MRVPIDATFEEPEIVTGNKLQYMVQLTQALQLIQEEAKKNIDNTQQAEKKKHNEKAKNPNINEGDLILQVVKQVKKGTSSKLTAKTEGPYIVENVGNNNTYKVDQNHTFKSLYYTCQDRWLKISFSYKVILVN